ncbi:zinc ribbon domain-containing protein [Microvirga lotononidis]|nr:zinc ribbon domain-containing protein [Microvirga lotononidis]WQO32104.1 zinc ribbon domain-containing protein [Microvirga lotononidis]
MGWIIFWIGGAILVAVVASNKGRSGLGWFFLSLILSPLLTLIGVAVMSRVEPAEASKTCPRCAETVKLAAAVCKHCGFEFSGAPQQASYKGIPYMVLANGQVTVTIQGKTTTWPNLAAFHDHVDYKRKLNV